ncbi:aminotransferase class I/II-fold pyridoxal phosphate-dependent enzyme [Bacillus sp. CLL-7-23]|uniref:Aminotransferase class I/II-fold pyridoxal phosphate-dependent enzyme n=1 Tax=Bacillus changyiensis TaxID=3004103 RepID=A0ABT4X554_9BACI|nr:aminotransferase class I/II-fold pyridoxal phosphate-dependent enzyme [Bacillus changyiensis]MDA7027422.1 aminotransferase class I/II-fold pyridoxal phosphate-dependent enzyme [Bacillus changyiensis]
MKTASCKMTCTSKDLLTLFNDLKNGKPVDASRIEDSLINQKLKQTLQKRNFDINFNLLNKMDSPPLRVDFMPLHRLITEEEIEDVLSEIKDVLPTGKFTSGPQVRVFESEIAAFLNKKYCLASSSGTDAMIVALKAAGVGHGDEVIMPANSFAATENAVLAVGGMPVFCDIDPDTFCMTASNIENRITSKTKCILPVHLYGKQPDMKAIAEIADHYRIPIIEDACQSIGVTGLGKYSLCTILSFNPYKNLGTCGKAGAIVTDQQTFATSCIEYMYHGFELDQKNKKTADYGFNSKIDNLQAAIGLARMKYLSLNNLKRLSLADRYIKHLQPYEEKGQIKLPKMAEDHVWHLFTIKIINGNRDQVKEMLYNLHHVETDVYYPILSHQQKTSLVKTHYQDTVLPVTESVHKQMLQLPLYPHLTIEEQDKVMEALIDVLS